MYRGHNLPIKLLSWFIEEIHKQNDAHQRLKNNNLDGIVAKLCKSSKKLQEALQCFTFDIKSLLAQATDTQNAYHTLAHARQGYIT